MNHTTTNFKIILSVSIIVFIGMLNISCSSSEYVCFKVKKSELMPDSLELGMDSLIVGGLKIATMAQRYYNKPISIGGGGNSFTGFTIPVHLIATEFGTYTATVGSEVIVIIGTNYKMPVLVEYTVTPDSIATTIEWDFTGDK